MSVVFWIPGQAEGALQNGTRIAKSIDRPGDTHPAGHGGVVMASHSMPLDLLEESQLEILPGDEFFYFVAWDDEPDMPIGIRGSAIRKE